MLTEYQWKLIFFLMFGMFIGYVIGYLDRVREMKIRDKNE